MQPVLQAPSTLGKRERFHQAVQAFGALCCPNCGQALTRIENDLLCASGHRLNVNRKGCINVLPRQTEGCYDAALFDARQRVLSSGCYQAVADCLESMLPPGPQKLLDAGCGEGWYLNHLLQNSPERAGIGVDISRDAILQATGQPSAAVWCVADLRKLPIADHSLSAVLNILTPASYAEFARILRPDGVLLKVYPAEGYLRQLRAARNMPGYEEGQVDRYLREHAELLREERVTVVFPVNDRLWRDFVFMTPLNQDLSSDEKQAIAEKPASTVTIDLHVACARLTGD